MNEPVILFDGFCGLCDRAVCFVLARDKRRHFRFAPIQSAIGQQMLRPLGYASEWVDSVALVVDGRVYLQSDAALHILGRLGWPWSMAQVFLIVPAVVRDAVYKFVARNRYRWFERFPACRVPNAHERDRFLA